jgi:4-amino-4-deoxy-L-arabinose transferase-like glycosyltransferase
VLIFVVSALILAPTIIYPYGRDQGIFGYAGHSILRGGVPFRDFWDPKPPALYYVYALAEALFGYSMSSVRVLDLVMQAATAAVLCAIAARLSGSAATAYAAGLLYALAYASRGWWNSAQPDDFLNLPAALAVLLFIRSLERDRVNGLSFLTGILAGVAFYLKYPMGALLPVFMGIILWTKGCSARTFAHLAAMTGGFLLIACGYALYLRVNGAWGEFFYAEFVWPRAYIRVKEAQQGITGALHIGDIARSHFSFAGLSALALIGYAWVIGRRSCPAAAHLVALWALVALANLYLQNKFYIYHFAPLLPPLCIGAALVVAFPFRRGGDLTLRLAAAVAVVAAVAASLLAVNKRYNFYCITTYGESAKALASRVLRGKGLGDYYMSARFTSDDFSLPADIVVAGYLAKNTERDEPVFIWGYETIVYYLAQRRCASRFVHNFPLRCDWVPERFGAELLADLRRERPKYILLVGNDPAWWATGTRDDSLRSLRRYPGIERYLAENYVFEKGIEDFLIFRRREAGGAA